MLTLTRSHIEKNNIQGKVIVSFVVGPDGKVSEAKVVQSVNPDLDAEALRVVSSLPGFETPGMKDGKPVTVKFMVPIFYALKE
jgi:protein TonB